MFQLYSTPHLHCPLNKSICYGWQARKSKEQKKHESWQLSVCRKISGEKNFPNDEIIEMYLGHKKGSFTESPISLLWAKPKVEALVEFLGYHQHWDPSYIQQRLLPLLSTHFLRDVVSNPIEDLLVHKQYEFHSIKRVKITYGRPCYLVTWRKAAPCIGNAKDNIRTELSDVQNEDSPGVVEVVDLLDEPDVPQILVDDGCSYLLTEENMELVQAAFPEKVERFLQEKVVYHIFIIVFYKTV
ncbi:flap endonuclease GEN-like [Thalictrum thalictroides]|uniref:Flap endonuclease GEN-like n=1 Tax=Thalictrum thalictroides TaxID=46969 RepID=A0A7J6VUH7_THATH|nr:flap endonuclease GEN-like [Thalictrum thalictroides]